MTSLNMERINSWRILSRVRHSLRRFGPQYSDFETMLDNINVLLRTVSVRIDDKALPPFVYILTILCFIIYYYIYLFSMIWCVFIYYPNYGDYISAIVVFSMGTYTQTCAIRLFFVMWNIKHLREVVMKYRKCNSYIPSNSRLADNMTINLRTVKLRATIIWLCLVINANIYLVMPLFLPGRHLPEDLLIVYGLNPMTESPNYEIAYLLFFLVIPQGSSCLATCTAFVIFLNGYTEALLLSLSEELHNIWSDAEKYFEDNKDLQRNISKESLLNSYVKNRLMYIIKLQNENISGIKILEKKLSISMALEFLLLFIGLVAELIGGIENTYLEIPFTFCQLFINCYLGQKLMDASSRFERAVYECTWENFNVSNQKCVLIMLQNSQKTLNLSAAGVATLSFQYLMSIIKCSYSFYTTLQSTLD